MSRDMDVQELFERLSEEYGTPAPRDDADAGQPIMEQAREREQQARQEGRRQSFVASFLQPYRDERQQLRSEVDQLQAKLREATLDRDLHVQRAQLLQTHQPQPTSLSGVAAQAIAPYAPGLFSDPLVRGLVILGLFVAGGWLVYCTGLRLLPAQSRA